MNDRPQRAAWAAFLVLLVAGVDTKTWMVVDLARSLESWSLLAWLPVALGGELLLAGLAYAAARALGRSVVGPALVVVAAVLCAEWATANVLSYAIDQTPLSWARLRGGDGGTIRDLGLVEPRDGVPVVVLAVLHLLLVVPALALARRVVARGSARLLPWACLVVGAALFLVDRVALRDVNMDVGRQPVLSLLEPADTDDDATADGPTEEAWRALAETRVVDDDKAAQPIARKPGGVAKNAIIFFAEGVPREATSLHAGVDRTPHLARRARGDGALELRRYRANFHKSIQAIFSVACSEYPSPDGFGIPEVNPRIDCGELSQSMRAAGVKAGLFHSGGFAFYDKLAFLGRRAYDVSIDRSALREGAPFQHRWGVDDRVMVDAVLRWIDGLQGERFFAWAIPIAAHYPYDVPPDVRRADVGDDPEKKFHESVRFVDLAFERLMQGLEQRGLADDTIVAFVADHGAPFPKVRRASRGKRLVYENDVRVPAVLFAPSVFAGSAATDRLGTHVDLLPTIADAMGVAPHPRWRGRSLVADDFAPQRVFLGGFTTTEHIGIVDGDVKTIVDRRRRTVEIYDLASDPREQRDLSRERPAEARAAVKDALAFYRWQLARVADAPTLGDELDVPGAIAARARVTLVRGAVPSPAPSSTAPPAAAPRVPCPVVPDAPEGPRACGDDEDAYQGRRTMVVAGVERDCVVVVPPREGAVEIAIDDPGVVAGLSQLHLGRRVAVEPAPTAALVVDDAVVAPLTFPGKHRTAWRGFAAARRSIVVTIGGGAGDAPVCVAFDDRSWTGRRLADED